MAKFNAKDPQNLSARAAVVIDAKTGSILFEKNADLKHLPASTTKIMTALITLEKCSPESVITVPEIEQEGTQMGLAAGDQVTVENLLYGMLINSGNDAASALASSCAQTQEQFISSMNEKAEDLNMNDTYFVNPTGFDNDYQYSTAHDLAKLANVTMSSPLISRIVATKSTVVTDITGTKTYFLENINELLEVVDGLEGIKTGQTQGSLENLVTRTTRNGNSVVVVVLGSKDRFTETQNLIEWAFDSYEWINPY
ncbi:hypothetical protein A3A54_02260 [Candidatus Curtissbacteria bacterium RIFCSPLOWO2_01_FULL_39_62]|uniref:Peptidase S11 D-alanyl-D-alanine carboxypeptidase A N-terminal domain-containing protein n=2 Tax=Candidatus Curtissiibacteriota TaxID=1752717 RepID=A0A1F5G8Y9_9BACT|nr:MAG: hypothetical protein A2775_02660 [Candidatus Curtissbacteria bacterium RIFCSPHIGHO2_01_FULL_39_57]OGD88295.1 MAG: hypothetical protein A3D04_00635 [Candidatus Curtissbacteria bacterium RIFCSPHIGHO2_02_FULL_40_16b]OGD90357.1 MAG: hypothetical protein A3E11_00645 [Candidatus Curtissbacteria bacterium RIFCSPHIGHO2_12_FULL_38_37]OGE00083.1 MAG: hypothetical protein A3J17_05240 [Candidatus Curtissbacteria bacterium RIFCSPLOWO2_02_FULL_40_11]OGE00594.1 MAG: hypothetical protein A3A54_02260 [C